MSKDIIYTPLFQSRSALKGFLSGSLIISGIFPIGILFQILLVFFGIFIFIDAVIPEEEVSIITTILSAFFGGIITIILGVFSFNLLWTIGITIFSIIYYAIRFYGKSKK